jgi:hypothetical protein
MVGAGAEIFDKLEPEPHKNGPAPQHWVSGYRYYFFIKTCEILVHGPLGPLEERQCSPGLLVHCPDISVISFLFPFFKNKSLSTSRMHFLSV